MAVMMHHTESAQDVLYLEIDFVQRARRREGTERHEPELYARG